MDLGLKHRELSGAHRRRPHGVEVGEQRHFVTRARLASGHVVGVDGRRTLEQAHVGQSRSPLHCVELAKGFDHEERGGVGDLAQELLALHVVAVGVLGLHLRADRGQPEVEVDEGVLVNADVFLDG